MIRISQSKATVNIWTAARLVAGLALAGVSVAMVPILIHYYPDERGLASNARSLMYLFGIVGFLVGWRSLGKQIAAEGGTGIGLGLRAGIKVTLYILACMTLNYLWKRIVKGDLIGEEPTEAFYVFADKFAEYGQYLLHGQILMIAAFMAITVGVLVRNTHHKWN